MARWTGEWLPGSGEEVANSDDGAPKWRGENLGLPENGAGSIARGGSRLLALVLDLVLSSLVTALFLRPEFQNPAAMQTFNLWSIGVWVVLTALPVAFFGITPAMAAVGIRVARLDGASMVGPWRALVRAALTFVIIPAAVRNIDGRSWLDRLTATVVIRFR